MKYSEKLKDPRWQKLSALVKERAKWKCERCGSSTKTLHAHHRLYEKGAEPWECAPNDLESLCWECHEDFEKAIQKLRWAVCDMETSEIKRLTKQILRGKWKRIEPTEARKKELDREVFGLSPFVG